MCLDSIPKFNFSSRTGACESDSFFDVRTEPRPESDSLPRSDVLKIYVYKISVNFNKIVPGTEVFVQLGQMGVFNLNLPSSDRLTNDIELFKIDVKVLVLCWMTRIYKYIGSYVYHQKELETEFSPLCVEILLIVLRRRFGT